MSQSLLLGECTREQLHDRLPEGTVVVPVAAVEQHGPHLPILTDTILVEGVARRALALAAQEIPVLLAPTQCYGSSHHHLDYVAMSLRSDTLLAVLRDLGGTLCRGGARRIFFLNGHGGNESIIDQVVRDLSLDFDGVFGAGSYWNLAWDELRDEAAALERGPMPGHAGCFETSGVMALRPDLIDTARLPLTAKDDWPRHHESQAARPTVEKRGWIKSIDGFTDDSRQADAAWGEAWLGVAARSVARFLVEFHARL